MTQTFYQNTISVAATLIAAGVTYTSFLDSPTAKIVIPAIIVSLAGGLVAAIRPWGKDKTWGFWASARALFVGVVAGVFCSFFIAGAKWVNEWWALGIEGFAAFLGQRIFDEVAKLGPTEFLSRALGAMRTGTYSSAPPPPVSPPTREES